MPHSFSHSPPPYILISWHVTPSFNPFLLPYPQWALSVAIIPWRLLLDHPSLNSLSIPFLLSIPPSSHSLLQSLSSVPSYLSCLNHSLTHHSFAGHSDSQWGLHFRVPTRSRWVPREQGDVMCPKLLPNRHTSQDDPLYDVQILPCLCRISGKWWCPVTFFSSYTFLLFALLFPYNFLRIVFQKGGVRIVSWFLYRISGKCCCLSSFFFCIIFLQVSWDKFPER